MRTVWLHISMLVIAIVIGHDAWMASNGHANVLSSDAAPGSQATHVHHQHDASPVAHPPVPEPVPEHCDPLRVAAPLNRDMSPSFDTVPTALLPDPAILMRFASTSRVFVETPPPHPPDLNRAFFQVYRL